jgi:hypothetical protein
MDPRKSARAIVVIAFLAASLVTPALVSGQELGGAAPGSGRFPERRNQLAVRDFPRTLSLEGALSPRSYGATASLRSVMVSTTAGSKVIRAANLADFAVGQHVALLTAGAPAAVGPPSGVTARPMTYASNRIVSTPGCKIDRANLNCSATWTWRIAAVDSRGGASPPSVPAVVNGGPAAPSSVNRIKLFWRSDTAAIGYLIYGCQRPGCSPTLKAVVPNNWYLDENERSCGGCARPAEMVYWYLGHSFGTDELSGAAMPGAGRRQVLYTTIQAINGSSITLSDAPSVTSGGIKLIHDDAPAFQAAINTAKSRAGTPGSNGGAIVIAPGQYSIVQTLDFYHSSNIHLFSLSTEGGVNSTQLVWRGTAGGMVFSLNQARDLLFESFAVTDMGGSTPGIIFDIDKYNAGQGITLVTTHDRFRDIALQRSGVAVRIGNRSDSNLERMRFDDVSVGSAFNGQGGWYGFYIAGNGQTYDELINGGAIGLRDAAIYLNHAGSVDTYALNLSHNIIDWYINSYMGRGIIEIGSNSELAAQHLYVSFGSGSGLRVAVYDSRLITDAAHLASNGYYIVDNASSGLELAGNGISAGGMVPFKIMVLGATAGYPLVVSRNNVFGYPQPFAVPPGATLKVMSAQDRACIDTGCHQHVLSRAATGG